jgi:Fe-S-cluster containining protein
MIRRDYRRLVAIVRRRAVAKPRRDWNAAMDKARDILDGEMYFKRGLKAECDGCGACCRQLGISVAFEDAVREPALIRKLIHLPTVQATHERLTGPNGEMDEVFSVVVPADSGPEHLQLAAATPCPMLVGNACSIHATKPDVCKNSPPGGFCCQYSRAKEGLPALPLTRCR